MVTSSIEDLDMPKTILARILKSALPDGTQIQKDAKTAMSKACTVFISYLTDAASELSKQAGRKTIHEADVLRALSELELEQALLESVQSLLAEHRAQGARRKELSKNVKSAQGSPVRGEASATPLRTLPLKRKDSLDSREDASESPSGQQVLAGGQEKRAKLDAS